MNADDHTLTADESSLRNRVNIALKSAFGCRSLCWIKSGRMGLAPAAAKAGDLLFVLWGGQMMQFLRRRRAGTFINVGESYVHGVTDTDGIGDEQTMMLE